MYKSSLLLLIVLMFGSVKFYRAGCTIIDFRPKISVKNLTPIDPTIIPIQVNIVDQAEASITKIIKGHPAVLIPRARFKIAGRVVSRRHYYGSWVATLSPVDLAIAWGPMAGTKYDDFVSYTHAERYYSYNYSHDFPGDPHIIHLHSANEHLIPANTHIEKALRSIKTGEIIELEGFLVNVEGNGGEPELFKLNTSLAREDQGAGACEIIYVQKVRLSEGTYL